MRVLYKQPYEAMISYLFPESCVDSSIICNNLSGLQKNTVSLFQDQSLFTSKKRSFIFLNECV